MTLMGFVSSVYIMIFITTTCIQRRRQYDTDGFCVECSYNDIHNYNMYPMQETSLVRFICVDTVRLSVCQSCILLAITN